MAAGEPIQEDGDIHGTEPATTTGNTGFLRLAIFEPRDWPTRNRYPTGFRIPWTRSQCSHPYANASAAASRPASGPNDAIKAWRRRNSLSSTNSVNELDLTSSGNTGHPHNGHTQ
jgi:hypothetical protein